MPLHPINETIYLSICPFKWLNLHFLYRIERDAQLLANRIALLKQEEMKTWKKIEETKKRANDVHRLKAKNEERAQKKMQMEMAEQQRQEQQRHNIQLMKQ